MNSSTPPQSFLAFLLDERGVTAIEYALIASGIAGAIIAAVMALGTSVNGMYTGVSTKLN